MLELFRKCVILLRLFLIRTGICVARKQTHFLIYFRLPFTLQRLQRFYCVPHLIKDWF